MKLDEIVIERKAGFLPYIIEDGEPVFYFMIPSRMDFGGIEPQVAKGQIDSDETVMEAALREAKEELGLKQSNLKSETIKLAWRGKLRGSVETYEMSIFTGEVKNKRNFNKPHHETGETLWMIAADFAKDGLESHRKIVNAARKIILDSLEK